MTKRKSTIQVKKIAEKLNLSPSTVSMVLNNKARQYRISKQTCERIFQAAKELGYEPPVRAKPPKAGLNQRLVIIFCPTNFEKGPIFYAGILKYFREKKLDYETILFPFEIGRLKEKAAYISKDFAAGAIMFALGKEDITFIENMKFDIPIVLYNRTAKRYSSVLTDDYAVGTGTMEHFIKRGHTRFGIVSPNYSSRALSMRVTGYRDKFKSHFPPGAAYLAPVSYGDDSDGGGYAAMRELLDGEQKPTAVFVASDNMVGGVLRCIHEAGLAVPGDIELISFGDKPIHQILRPTITSFSPPTDTMSYNCAMLLHRFIEEGILTDNVKLSFEAACVFRESCPE
jgi:LacI family transcriptional regulator